MKMSVHDFTVKTPKDEEKSLSDYKGQVMLIVNTATKCGLAPQFDGLEALHKNYKEEGLAVIGFPSNDFLNQEPVENEAMEETCKVNFGVTFPLFAKVKVNGADAHPLYKYLKKEEGGMLGSAIKWNFTKFLVDQEGRVVSRYGPKTEPKNIEDDIRKLLNKNE